MNSKARFIPLIVLGAIVLSLIAIIPALSATGKLRFYDISDTDEDQEWARSGGLVHLEVDDPDLDVPIKYVLIPGIDLTELTSDATMVKEDKNLVAMLTVAATTSSDVIVVGEYKTDATTVKRTLLNRLQVGDKNTDAADQEDGVLYEGNTILLVEKGEQLGETVREVIGIKETESATTTVSVGDDSDRDGIKGDGKGKDDEPAPDADREEVLGYELTLDRPLTKNYDGAKVTLYKVTNPAAEADECPTCARAQEITSKPNSNYIMVANAPVVKSGVRDDAAYGDDKTVGLSATAGDNRFDGISDSRGANSHDVRFVKNDGSDADGNDKIDQLNNSEERVDFTSGPPGIGSYLVYWGSAQNDTGDTVEVRSSADSDGIEVVLIEEAGSPGVFRLSIELTDSEESDPDRRALVDDDDTTTTPKVSVLRPFLRVNPSGTVTMRYADGSARRSASIDVETTRPVLSNFDPAHNAADEDDRPEVSADITDSDSGINDADVFIVFAHLDGKNEVSAKKDPVSVSVDEDGRLKDITGGVRAEQRLPSDLEIDGDFTVAWWVVTQDEAGNVAVSDQDTASDSPCNPEDFPGLSSILGGKYSDKTVTTVTIDAITGSVKGDKDMGGCQPFIVRVDDTDPQLDSSITGSFWDDDIEDDDKTNVDPTKGKSTSIRLNFNEDLDGASVSASDFEVDGRTPLAANHYSDAASYVFLTVPALGPSDRPKVELVGEVADIAGNTTTTGTTGDDDGGVSNDGIAPILEVTLEGVTSGARPVTDKKITITVVANENTANPSVMITKVRATNADGEGLLRGDEVKLTPKVKSPRTYETTWSTTAEGLYNVYVTATDTDGNMGKLGMDGSMSVTTDENDPATDDAADDTMRTVADPVDLSSDTKALLFEVDTAGPDFVLNPTESDDENAFIRIDFSSEGSEYSVRVKGPGDDGQDAPDVTDMYFDERDSRSSRYADVNLDADGKLTTDKEKFDMDDLDTYGMVTILSATLDGDDISGSLERLDDNSFLYTALNLAIGEYKIKIDAEDSAGNDNESSETLKITERKPFKLNIRAGVSLISFPGEPMDSDINAVFPADHPAQEVIAYDPTQPGRWFASQRDETTGLLDGNLKTISGSQAYLVRSTSSKAVNVVLYRPSSHDLVTPPRIDLVAGWNLVPVADITYGKAQGDTISYKAYFGSTGAITRVYGVNTILNRLELIDPPDTSDDATDDEADGGELEFGKGYWVFATEETSVAPGRD